MRVLAGLSAAIFALFGLASFASAESEDVFVVPRVPVQAQAESAGEAKNRAQSLGRRRALDILLRRLTVEQDWVYLPNLRRNQPAQATAPGVDGKSPIAISGAQVRELESGFVVFGEKGSATTYRALITYRFNPESVRRLLQNARIPYSESQTRTALVLPVLQTDRGVYLWEENNPWMRAWKTRPFTHELTPMTAPLGDLEDASRISARQALALDQTRLQALAAHYSVPQIILAHARLKQDDGENRLSVRLVNGYRESGQADTVLNLEDVIERETAATPVADVFAKDVGDVLGQAYLVDDSGDFPALAERSIERAIADYSKEWKARTLIDYSVEGVLEATAFYQSVADWAKIRAALVETPLVEFVQVSALSRKGAEMRMRVFGDPSRLVTAMENQGLTLWTETGERWFIATPETAGVYRGQRFLRRRVQRRGADFERSNDDIYAPPSNVFQNEYDAKLGQGVN